MIDYSKPTYQFVGTDCLGTPKTIPNNCMNSRCVKRNGKNEVSPILKDHDPIHKICPKCKTLYPKEPL